MFKIFCAEASKQYYKVMYCNKNFERCERKKLREKGAAVADNLLPDGNILK